MTTPPELPYDGERFLPEIMEGSIALEHIHRYLFATQFVTGKRVLDIASGEGYGSAILAESASHVIGVDVDGRAVDHSTAKYPRDNLRFQQGDCSRIPLETGSIDVVVSFETIEHHDQHEAMMSEIKRVLHPDGLLVISSPDRYEYSDKPGFKNPFHVKELYAAEFSGLLAASFKHFSLLRQRVLFGSALLSDSNMRALQYFDQARKEVPSKVLPAAPYLIAVASDNRLPAVRGGFLEEDVSALTTPIIRATNTQIATLLRNVTAPDSKVLRSALESAWYLEHNSDLARDDIDTFAHWMNNGASEGRVPAADVSRLVAELLEERERALLVKAGVSEAGAAASGPTDQRDDLLAQYLALRSQLDARQLELQDVEQRYLDQERDLRVQLDARHAELRGAEQAHGTRAKDLQAELAAAMLDARKQLEQHMLCATQERQTLLDQERDLRAQLDARQAELREAERAHGAREQELQGELGAAARERQALVDRHLALERELRMHLEAQQTAWREAERGQLARQKQLEEALTQARTEARDELEAQRASQARDRESLTSQSLALERSLREQLEARHEELRRAEQAHRERERELEAELTAQEHDFAERLTRLTTRLAELEASWSWKIMAPFRTVAKRVSSRLPRASRSSSSDTVDDQPREQPHARD